MQDMYNPSCTFSVLGAILYGTLFLAAPLYLLGRAR